MNAQEWSNLLNILIGVIGGYLTAHGLASDGQISQAATDITTIAPAAASLASIAWAIWSHWNMKKVPEKSIAVHADDVKGQPIKGTVVIPTKSVLKVVGALAGIVLAFGQMRPAQARWQPGQPIHLTGNINRDFGSSKQTDLLAALDDKLLPDLQYAEKIATATNSKLTAACYSAWIDIIQARQKAVTDQSGAEIPEPDPHVITDFEKMVELRNALQPDSDFMIKCSPVANMLKTDILNFMGKVIGGGVGLATVIPGL